jgi:predicted GNAT family acetyltransferase
MPTLTDDSQAQRYEAAFDGGVVFADYGRSGNVISIRQVEAEPQLRGSGAAGAFMQLLVDHAREQGLQLRPICSYAVVWLKRHRDAHDVLVKDD